MRVCYRLLNVAYADGCGSGLTSFATSSPTGRKAGFVSLFPVFLSDGFTLTACFRARGIVLLEYGFKHFQPKAEVVVKAKLNAMKPNSLALLGFALLNLHLSFTTSSRSRGMKRKHCRSQNLSVARLITLTHEIPGITEVVGNIR